jgi:hypothetical protein
LLENFLVERFGKKFYLYPFIKKNYYGKFDYCIIQCRLHMDACNNHPLTVCPVQRSYRYDPDIFNKVYEKLIPLRTEEEYFYDDEIIDLLEQIIIHCRSLIDHAPVAKGSGNRYVEDKRLYPARYLNY